MPRVSVVMTVYNQADYLREAVDSIIAQSFRDFELILVDDGSSDDSASIAKSYGDPVRYVHRENGGLGAARNTGVDEARGAYIAFCDADDIHLPFRLEAHAHVLDRFEDVAVVFSELSPYENGVVVAETLLRDRVMGPTRRTFDEEIQAAFGAGQTCRSLEVPVPEKYLDHRVFTGRVPQLIALTHVAWGGASMFRRSALRAVGGHDPDLRRATDWYVVSKLSKVFDLAFLDVPVLWYRRHPSQLTQMSGLGARCARDVMLRVWKRDPVFYAKYGDVIDRSLGSAYWLVGTAAASEGDWAEAEKNFFLSVRTYPRQKRAYVDLARAAAKNRFLRS